MEYKEEDYLQLSGIQHFCFCRRQWALIHVEHLWTDNYLTTDGSLMHENAHDSDFIEKRGNTVITRGMNIHSSKLGISGQCDVVEFHKSENGIELNDYKGLWLPYPIEYKRGEPGNYSEANELQLCAQALCLEEMLCCQINEGALYYGKIKHRVEISLTDELKEKVRVMLKEMHDLFQRGYTPKVKPSKSCNACSLKELCVPKLMKNKKVSDYLNQHLESYP